MVASYTTTNVAATTMNVGGVIINVAGYRIYTVTSNMTDFFSLTGTVLAEKFIGSAGAETFYGQKNNDLLYGYGGADILNGDEGNDLLDGGDGNDLLYGGRRLFSYAKVDPLNPLLFEYPDGDGNDSLYGGKGNDQLFGGMGDDYLNGGSENDYLKGDDDYIAGNNPLQVGNDVLLGGSGYDILVGGKGHDTLTGSGSPNVGDGMADWFVYNDNTVRSSDSDTITDFERGIDQIVLKASVFNNLATTTRVSPGHPLANMLVKPDNLDPAKPYPIYALDSADFERLTVATAGDLTGATKKIVLLVPTSGSTSFPALYGYVPGSGSGGIDDYQLLATFSNGVNLDSVGTNSNFFVY